MALKAAMKTVLKSISIVTSYIHKCILNISNDADFQQMEAIIEDEIVSNSPPCAKAICCHVILLQKGYYVTSKHTYKRHKLNWSCSFCARPCLLDLHVNAWCGVVVVLQ